jgi:methylmalonyl-CoA mutase
VRGTVQADILKEDQAQNTCIFSTEFALRMMGDVQEFFTENKVRNFYSVSISGYHIAEAGANPITQLALHAEPTASPTSSTTCRAGCRSTSSRRT